VAVEIDDRPVARTKAFAQRSSAPTWNEEIKLTLEKASKLVLVVRDEQRKGSDDACCSFEIDLKKLKNTGAMVKLDNQAMTPKGTISLEYTFSVGEAWYNVTSGFECSEVLHHGCTLLKFHRHSNGGVPQERFFSVSEDNLVVQWMSKRKSAAKSQVPLRDVKEVREGQKSDSFTKRAGIERFKNRSFAIIYGNNHESLDLVALSDDAYRVWTVGIRFLLERRNASSAAGAANIGAAALMEDDGPKLRQRWIRELWDIADKDNSGTLTVKEVEALLKSLNCFISHEDLERRIAKADRDGDHSTLTFDEFMLFFSSLSERPEVNEILTKYGKNGTMTVTDLKNFLTEEQKEKGLSSTTVDALIRKYEPSAAKTQGRMTMAGLMNLLLGMEGNLFNFRHAAVFEDMHQPLTHYFMASSHNTYLTGDQLQSDSSVECYIRALREGCRCVELDCWDGPDDEPIIYHGHTLTSKILFKDVIEAVRDHAFASSPYPVVLSLENHCSLPQQEVMARHMKEILGNMLVTGEPNEDGVFPSPEALRNKVLVKGKYASNPDAEISDDEDDDEPAAAAAPKTEEKPKKVKLAPTLGCLAVYCRAVHWKSFAESQKKAKYYEMSSFAESKAVRLSTEQCSDFVKYNIRQMSRIYPAGTRVDSSNYDPTPMWCAGSQIVALNYQTPDRSMQLNRGRFRRNGRCGYVLKPLPLRQESAYSADMAKAVKGVLRKTVTIRVSVMVFDSVCDGV
jgi:Ca2+-binding EF-hand superfamily protein